MIKENYEFMLNISEFTERFEDVRLYQRNYYQKEMSVTERLLVYNAYKKILHARRNVWHPVYILEKKEPEKAKVISWYRGKLESEMEEICKEAISLSDHQAKISKSNEQKVFFLKMKGDYYRYQAEYHCVEENKEKYGVSSVQNTFACYEQASEIALNEFPTTHPLRLSLALNFSVFFYDIVKSPERALTISKVAYQDGLTDLCTVEGEHKKEAEKILGMINENIVLWSSDSR